MLERTVISGGLVWWLVVVPSWAAQECATITAQPRLAALATALACTEDPAWCAAEGRRAHPRVRGSEVCFTDPPFVVADVITEAALAAKETSDRQRDADIEAERTQRRTDIRTKLIAGDGLTAAEADWLLEER